MDRSSFADVGETHRERRQREARARVELHEIDGWSLARVSAALGLLYGASALAYQLTLGGQTLDQAGATTLAIGGFGGLVAGLVSAWTYNLAAGIFGGVVIDVSPTAASLHPDLVREGSDRSRGQE